ncbi:MAG: DNA polymerase I [Thermoleophilia bacterium]|nr:DNA polymerase I [Thermoleophilia bacterium]
MTGNDKKRQQPDISGAVFLIDGNSLAYRAFYALPETIATSDGFPTNALYGFSTMLTKILADYRPAAIVVAWDAGKKVFRHEDFAGYKANRKPTPDSLSMQLERFGELVEAFGFESLRKEGYEADDILATLAREARERGQKAVVVTADRDALQLVGDGIYVMTNTKGISEVKVYDRQGVEERFGIPPEKIPDFIGLKGDVSDNIPGVPGIGDKTASVLLADYDSIEELLNRVGELKGKRRRLLEEYGGQARLSRELAMLNDEVPVNFTEALAGVHEPDRSRLREVLSRLEFNTLVKRLEEMGVLEAPEEAAELLDLEKTEVDELAGVLTGSGAASLAWELRGEHLRLAFYTGREPIHLAITSPGRLAGILNTLAGSGKDCPRLLCHDYKALLALAPNTLDCAHDTLVGAYLLRPLARTYKPDQLAASANILVGARAERPGERALGTRAAQTYHLARIQMRQLEEEGQDRLFNRVEMPLVRVLADMERTGIRIDLARLGELAAKVSDQIDQLADEIREMAGGGDFNIDSPQQLAAVLFETLGLPAGKKTKTGYSTDASVLKGLRHVHPVVPKIEAYRELTKLSGTYLMALPRLADPDTWRIHTTFNQTVTATGRISSSNPNLQNIPIRTPLGEKIRDCFVAAEGHKLIAADYSQVELRVMAHLSGESKLRQAFKTGGDVHRDTAAEVFGVPPEEVNGEQRGRAKAVNFGIMYGISAFGLAEQLDISREEAGAYIAAYLERYPNVAAFRDRIVERALEDGYVKTIMGRRRPIPELRAGEEHIRRLGERLAVNTVIQGSAADIIKVAMVGCHRALAEKGSTARLVLQVHDELVFESPEAEVDVVADLARREMTTAWPLDPPLVADLGVGDTWLRAK